VGGGFSYETGSFFATWSLSYAHGCVFISCPPSAGRKRFCVSTIPVTSNYRGRLQVCLMYPTLARFPYTTARLAGPIVMNDRAASSAAADGAIHSSLRENCSTLERSTIASRTAAGFVDRHVCGGRPTWGRAS